MCRPWQAHLGAVTAIDLHAGDRPDVLKIVTGGHSGAIKQWRLDGSEQYSAMELRTPVNAVHYDPSGRLIAIAGANGDLFVRYAGGLALRPIFRGFLAQVTCLAFDSEWLNIIAGSRDGTVRLIENVGLGMGLQMPTDGSRIGSLVFRPNGKLLAGASQKNLYLWAFDRDSTIRPLTLRRTLPLKGKTGAILAIDPKDRWLAFAGENTLGLWDLQNDRVMASYPIDCRAAYAIGFNSDGSLLAVGGAGDIVDLFDSHMWRIIARLPANHGTTRSLVFSNTDQFLFTAGDDARIRRWTLAAGKIAAEAATPSITQDNHKIGVFSLAMSAKGDYLISGDWSGHLSRWGNNGTTRCDHVQAELGSIQNIRVHPLGEAVYTSSDAGYLRARSYRTGARLVTFPTDGEAGGVYGLALSADGRTLASGNGDGFVKLWHAHWTDMAEIACHRLEQHPRFKAREREPKNAKAILDDGAKACASLFWEDPDAKIVFELPAGK